MLGLFGHRIKMVNREQALTGRDQEMPVADRHAVLGTPMKPPFPEGTEQLVLGLGCFWGAERAFWTLPGVYTTAVGYAGGYTANPAYEEVCTGQTGHAEVVLVVFDPKQISSEEILRTFWESHDPTQGMRQGNDLGTQYRSVILYSDEEQRKLAEATRTAYAEKLRQAGYEDVSTEIVPLEKFYYAEDYHQQYLHKVPNGYCPVHSTGVSCPIGLNVSAPTAEPANLSANQ
jgi:peptide-methionine (S)-S-oxide reductase